MTDRKGASAPGFQHTTVRPTRPEHAAYVTAEEWLWLAEWLEKHAAAADILRRVTDRKKFHMAASGCRWLNQHMRESGDG